MLQTNHIKHPTHSESSNSFRPLGVCPLAHLSLDPAHEVPEWFGAWDDVEWGRQCCPFFKVTHPQLCPGKFPLNVRMILQTRFNHVITHYKANHYLFHTHDILLADFMIWAHSNVLVGVVHHGYEHVEEHHEWDNVVSPKHRGTDKLCKLMVCIHVGHVQTDQAKDWPEERLKSFK